MFSLICVRINRRVNNSEAGDLRRYRAHYDVIVMVLYSTCHLCVCVCVGWGGGGGGGGGEGENSRKTPHNSALRVRYGVGNIIILAS